MQFFVYLSHLLTKNVLKFLLTFSKNSAYQPRCPVFRWLLYTYLSIFRLHQERWFRKGFYEMETPGKEGVIGVQELKKFMQKVNCKITTSVLKEKFSKYDIGNTGDIGFDDFCSVIQELNFPRQLFRDVFVAYSIDSKRVCINEFQQFLEKEQVHPILV